MVVLLCFCVRKLQAEPVHAGLLFDEFDLTLELGQRTEAVGPFFYSETQETQRTWAIPPLFAHTVDPATESEEYDFCYPLLSYDRFGEQYRFHIFQLISLSGGRTQNETYRDRFTVFPIYFQQRSSDPGESYTAVFPIYGHLKNRLFRDEIFFVMFPIYGQSRKADVVTDNYVYPFFHLRHGDHLTGWQFWPLVGHEHKDPTTQTNGFGDLRTIGGHDDRFVLWPFYFDNKAGMGTANPEHTWGSIPAFSLMRSPQRDSTTVLWPFFSRIDDRGQKYREWEAPWPLIVFARGEGKTATRVFPFFSRAYNTNLQSDFYLWPVYKYNRVQAAPLDRQRMRIFFFLYSDMLEKNTETGAALHRVDCWPFFSYRRDFTGNSRLQVLALLEPFVPNVKSIDRDYSQLWSIWRSERNPRTGATSQSLLWNLYRRDTTRTTKRSSVLFGLFQSRSDATGKSVRVFYIPLSKSKARTAG